MSVSACWYWVVMFWLMFGLWAWAIFMLRRSLRERRALRQVLTDAIDAVRWYNQHYGPPPVGWHSSYEEEEREKDSGQWS